MDVGFESENGIDFIRESVGDGGVGGAGEVRCLGSVHDSLATLPGPTAAGLKEESETMLRRAVILPKMTTFRVQRAN